MRILSLAALAAAGFLATQAPAWALNNPPPPSGPLVLDLTGQAPPTTYQTYTTSFTATSLTSVVTFVFRHDPGYFAFDNASVIDTTLSSGNLLLNPSFESGTVGGAAVDWSYFAQSGVTYTGVVATATTGSPLTPSNGSNFWYDGSVGGYDGLSQSFGTTIGDQYSISFDLNQFNSTGASPTSPMRQTCDNGGSGTSCNAVDMLVYAGDTTPSTSVPEPASLAVLAMGLAGLGAIRRRRG